MKETTIFQTLWPEPDPWFWPGNATAKHRKKRAALATAHIFRAMAKDWYKDDPNRCGAPASTDGKKIYVNSRCPNVRSLAKAVAKAAGFRGKIVFSKH